MSLLSEFSATVLQGQQIVGNTISCDSFETADMIVGDNMVVDNILSADNRLVINSAVEINGSVNSNSFLSLHQYNGFSSATFTNTAVTTTTSPINYWAGGVLAPNGKVYMAPNNFSSVLVYDPKTKVIEYVNISQFGNGTQALRTGGGVVAKNGKLYMLPDFATTAVNNIVVLDTNDHTNVYDIKFTKNESWYGSVLGLDGKIYGVPRTSSTTHSVIVIDPVTDAVSFYDTGIPGASNSWNCGVLGTDGKIYCCPRLSPTVLVISPLTSPPSFSTISILSGQYRSGALAPNGNIYMVPTSGTNILKIVTATSTSSLVGIGVSAFWGAVLSPDGNIYCIPNDTNYSVYKFNPVTETASLYFTFTSTSNIAYLGGVLTPYNTVVACPFREGRVMEFGVNLPSLPSWMLQAYFNKL